MEGEWSQGERWKWRWKIRLRPGGVEHARLLPIAFQWPLTSRPSSLSLSLHSTVVAVAGHDYCIVAASTRLSTGYSILTREETKLCRLCVFWGGMTKEGGGKALAGGSRARAKGAGVCSRGRAQASALASAQAHKGERET
jgi:hypothetical protein